MEGSLRDCLYGGWKTISSSQPMAWDFSKSLALCIIHLASKKFDLGCQLLHLSNGTVSVMFDLGPGYSGSVPCSSLILCLERTPSKWHEYFFRLRLTQMGTSCRSRKSRCQNCTRPDCSHGFKSLYLRSPLHHIQLFEAFCLSFLLCHLVSFRGQ